MAAPKLFVKQHRSEISRPWQQRAILKGLGLRGRGSSVTVNNDRAIRGMIRKVIHLVHVQEVAGQGEEAQS